MITEQHFGKYMLTERLGQGGMADVWRARVAGPQGFERVVVLKRILPHLVADQKARALFEREARVVSRLSHANIVQVFEFGEVDGEYYLAMEYVDGRDLAAAIRAGAGSAPLAAMVIRDVCRALTYAHELRDAEGAPLRILHRDVSPSNVMLGFDGSVRLLDFGIAKAFSDARDKRSVKGTIRGKFGYLAPEILDGLEPDARADLFAVGVVLHETLSGKRLFRGSNDIETMALIKRAEVPRPSTLNPSVPPLLDEICMRALSRDRELRYASGREMADALDEIAHELRFGPTQLAETLARFFPPMERETWTDMQDSAPRTVPDQPVLQKGLGTARAPLNSSETPVGKKRPASDEAHHATVPEQRRGRRPVAINAAMPVPRQSVHARRRRVGMIYLVSGVLAGVIIAVLSLVYRDRSARVAVPPIDTALTADDLALPPPPDLAERAVGGHAHEEEGTKLIFPPASK